MPDQASPGLPRIALLSSDASGPVHLRKALEGLVEIAYVASPSDFDAERLAQARVSAALLSLDSGEWPVTMGAALEAAAIPVVYDDPETSLGLDGWARTRWLRHLLAKLQGSRHVDPPRPGEPGYPGGAADDITAEASDAQAGSELDADTKALAAMVDANLGEGALRPAPEAVVSATAGAASEPDTPAAVAAPAEAEPTKPRGVEIPSDWALVDPDDASAVSPAATPAPAPAPAPAAGREHDAAGPKLSGSLAGLELVPMDVPGEDRPPPDPIERWLHKSERGKRATEAKDAAGVKAQPGSAGSSEP